MPKRLAKNKKREPLGKMSEPQVLCFRGAYHKSKGSLFCVGSGKSYIREFERLFSLYSPMRVTTVGS